MIEEAGRDIDGMIGRVIEVDERSWQVDQAKFMRVRVDLHLPIEKPLRKGGEGYITNMARERCWVSFKYERLPTFCFTCGKIGHDEKHCSMVFEKQPLYCQYGEWMRAGVVSKGSNDGMRASRSRSHEPKSGGEPGTRAQSTAEELVVFVQSGNEGSGSLGGNYNLEEREKVGKKRNDGRSEMHAASNQSRWDNLETLK